nr:NAD(P)-dependent oxidoreductase [Paraburkholderia hospita]
MRAANSYPLRNQYGFFERVGQDYEKHLKETSVSAARIGMIGIGQLGLPIATNLMAAGFSVVGFRRTDRAEFVARGGVAMDEPAEVVKACDVLLLCLPSQNAQLEILDGPGGVLASLSPGQTVIELGTYSREFKITQAERIRQTGAKVLEVEVSGTPIIVEQRKAALFIGGEEDVLASVKPVLDAISSVHFHIGELGSAVNMKLIANYLLTIHTLAAAEAINMGARAGFNPHRVVEIIKQSAGSSAMFAIRGPMMASRTFSPAPGPFCTLEKYLTMADDLASNLGCATPLFSTAKRYFEKALTDGIGGEDIAAVIKLIEAESTH